MLYWWLMLVSKFAYPELVRIDSEAGRMYETPSGKLPSVTSILSKTKSAEKTKALDGWRDNIGNKEADRILKESGDIGTIIHSHLEAHIKGIERPTGTNIIRVQAKKLADILIEKGLKDVSEIYGTEVGLHYPSLYAGTADAIGLHDGHLAILDFKNTRKIKKEEYIEDYKFQLAAYASAHDVVYGTNTTRGVILMVCRGDTRPADFGVYQEFIVKDEEFEKYKDDWAKRVEKYYSSNNQ
jgi:hypothetical protein